MKKLLLMALFTTSLLGCASEQYFVGHGSEALVYKEHHNFEFAVKNRGETAKQLKGLIQDIESMDKEATYVVDYKSPRTKQMLQVIFEQYPSYLIAPQRVTYRSAQLLPTDLNIQVTLTRLKTQECKPAQIHVRLRQQDCFTESMRLKQVAYKSRLVGEQ
ncbi:hypothetical protein [Vibrio crassostreae]|uniref:hypothetical protein n=1 Tax=Vibrio crassostreae TaxID=246167 RepID=UPI000F48E5CD|nr:hypothetical protein [Vibrio crassostreae]ROO77114.1 hypothetical protein EDB53_0948 [Vibrio crassostreae]ROR70183.1 hypothetical protein EDB59_0830 [Vibrio crassostreae]ROR75315.1 hypothetical protein EDB54_0822 [Vibrio crassostreae]TCV32764.1 hypothetical protein EDB70_101748 [Vibrio crassostreae]TQK40378.1 hypothetical protein FB441_1003 [Vibrio crassostreae]